MAEENTAVEAAEEARPSEDGQEQQQPSPVEELAAKMGWAPKDQFRGAEEDWKPAEDFILASRDINRDLSRQLRGVREEVSRIARTSADLTAQALAGRDQHWQNVHTRAVEEGDAAAAAKAVDERLKLKTQAPQDNQEPPETVDFKERHKNWFGVNRLATARAMEIADRSRMLGSTPAQQLEDAEAGIRREFPELFTKPAKTPAGVQTGAARNTNGAGGKKGFADMPQASQDMARDYLRRHGIPLEKTAESYWADKANHERMVG